MKKTIMQLLLLISVAFVGCKKSDEGPISFDAFPLFIQTSDNNIKLYYRHGTSHAGNDGVIMVKSSTDGGETFTTADTLLSEPGVDVRNVSGGVTSTGRIILFVLKYNAPASVSISQGYIYSDDGGKTWSAYQTLPTNHHSFFTPYGRLINIGNGKIMQAWYGRGGGNNYSTYVIMSNDNGTTWSPPVRVAASTVIRYCEASYAYLDNGTILGLIRDDRDAVFQQVISLDNGLTWSDQGTITFDSGMMVSPLLTTYTESNGEKYLVAYYANRITDHLCAVIGTGSGLKSGVSGWIPSSLKILATNKIPDFGYPSVINPDKTAKVIGVYYKASSTSRAKLDFFKFTPSY